MLLCKCPLNNTKFSFYPKRAERFYNMGIYVCRKISRNGNEYLALEARASWGRVVITFDKSAILEILPNGLDHRKLDAVGVKIGEIVDEISG